MDTTRLMITTDPHVDGSAGFIMKLDNFVEVEVLWGPASSAHNVFKEGDGSYSAESATVTRWQNGRKIGEIRNAMPAQILAYLAESAALPAF